MSFFASFSHQNHLANLLQLKNFIAKTYFLFCFYASKLRETCKNTVFQCTKLRHMDASKACSFRAHLQQKIVDKHVFLSVMVLAGIFGLGCLVFFKFNPTQ